MTNEAGVGWVLYGLECAGTWGKFGKLSEKDRGSGLQGRLFKAPMATGV